MRFPLARSERLVVEELGEELLVYDLDTHRAHSLGAAAAQVWHRCDGSTSIEALRAELDLDSDTVARALGELEACELLDGRPSLGEGSTRREMTVKVAKVGGVAAVAPLIMSLAAPLPAAAVTVTPEFCTSNGTSQGCGIDCMSRNCCCCCQQADPNPFCTGMNATMCCLPTAQCGPIFGGNCSDTAPCP